MNTDEHELPPEQDEPLDAPLPAQPPAPSNDDTLLDDELAGFSAVAAETVQAVDTLYGGLPPLEDDYAEYESDAIAVAGDELDEDADDTLIGDEESLLAVASISDVTAEREAEREFVLPAFEAALPMPPMTTLKRGHLGSLVPGLLLIGIGGWLTLTTTAGTPLDPMLMAAVGIGAVIVTLLAQWLGTGRWGRGYLFFALVLLFATGFIAFSIQPGGLSLMRGWPLLVLALGVAIILSGLLSRPASRKLVAPGVLLVVAGLLGTITLNNVLPPQILTTAATWWPAVVVALALIWLLPLVFRRRG